MAPGLPSKYFDMMNYSFFFYNTPTSEVNVIFASFFFILIYSAMRGGGTGSHQIFPCGFIPHM